MSQTNLEALSLLDKTGLNQIAKCPMKRNWTKSLLCLNISLGIHFEALQRRRGYKFSNLYRVRSIPEEELCEFGYFFIFVQGIRANQNISFQTFTVI
jgi:hypothetical protein